jgi:hypothetical protein
MRIACPPGNGISSHAATLFAPLQPTLLDGWSLGPHDKGGVVSLAINDAGRGGERMSRSWYEADAGTVGAQYNAIDPAELQDWLRDLLPTPPCTLLDIGANGALYHP